MNNRAWGEITEAGMRRQMTNPVKENPDMNAFRNPAAVVCVHCHALISGDPAVFTRIGDLVEFGDCGRHKRTNFDASGPLSSFPAKFTDAEREER